MERRRDNTPVGRAASTKRVLQLAFFGCVCPRMSKVQSGPASLFDAEW